MSVFSINEVYLEVGWLIFCFFVVKRGCGFDDLGLGKEGMCFGWLAREGVSPL